MTTRTTGFNFTRQCECSGPNPKYLEERTYTDVPTVFQIEGQGAIYAGKHDCHVWACKECHNSGIFESKTHVIKFDHYMSSMPDEVPKCNAQIVPTTVMDELLVTLLK